MSDIETSRLSRLITLLTLLQTKRLFTASDFARKFEVSTRTIYRDLQTLEKAGIPILMEEGKGYTLMDGYKLPPVMFTEEEANALITAEKLVSINKDVSLSKNYSEAIIKIKSVLRYHTKDKVNLLSNRVEFWQDPTVIFEFSNLLSSIQNSITNFNVLEIEYQGAQKDETTKRCVEPFAVINKVGENWYLIALCRTRKDFRLFRFDRIKKLQTLEDNFTPHKISLKEYLEKYRQDTFSNP
ncbi:helix-turn-helix transcriptional regulator [Flavobacterium hercynium]|uniref:DNA-binding transcriptional regulator n=1 Tax=Flavobacterium hercynium TaxID=387094 RepID=A0A226H7K0_9FLAO|nr:YafY family protein [Flavobacterium hercynium]OXA90064.1 DNA-binding transcriptional regulator [Flavobacterium hercynium]SMP14721.1 HTH domain-containing protein [Flavobacterium hercynium]